MNMLYLAAFASFVFGVFGFIIVRFWIRPILNYRKIKKQTAAGIDRYIYLASEELQTDEEEIKHSAKELRVCAAHLTDALDLELPHWYRLILKNREESPVEASKVLMKLSNTTRLQHIQRQVDEIRRSLLLSFPGKVSKKS